MDSSGKSTAASVRARRSNSWSRGIAASSADSTGFALTTAWPSRISVSRNEAKSEIVSTSRAVSIDSDFMTIDVDGKHTSLRVETGDIWVKESSSQKQARLRHDSGWPARTRNKKIL